MEIRTIFMGYGLIRSGLIGYMLTHAKSALISGSATGLIMILLAFLATKSKGITWLPVGFSALFSGVFAWRFSIVYPLLEAQPEKLPAAILLGVMVMASVVAVYFGFVENNKR